MYPALVASRRGAQVKALDWTAPDELQQHPSRKGPWVEARVRPAVGRYIANPVGDAPLLIGSSFGTLASAVAADYDLPGIWLTPTLSSDPRIVDALRRAKKPFMLIGGTADEEWDGALAKSLTPYVVEISDADHWLIVPGSLRESATVLGYVAECIEYFLDTVLWPVEKRAAATAAV